MCGAFSGGGSGAGQGGRPCGGALPALYSAPHSDSGSESPTEGGPRPHDPPATHRSRPAGHSLGRRVSGEPYAPEHGRATERCGSEPPARARRGHGGPVSAPGPNSPPVSDGGALPVGRHLSAGRLVGGPTPAWARNRRASPVWARVHLAPHPPGPTPTGPRPPGPMAVAVGSQAPRRPRASGRPEKRCRRGAGAALLPEPLPVVRAGQPTRPYQTLLDQIFWSFTTSPVLGACQILLWPA